VACLSPPWHLDSYCCQVYTLSVSKTPRSPKPPKRPATAEADRIYRIDELAEAAELPVRTIRYYLQRGLLPAPEFRGPQTVYTGAHRIRLDALRLLQERGLGLDAIARLLDALPDERIAALARGEELPELVPLAGAAVLPTAAPPEPARKSRGGVEPPRTTLVPIPGSGELRQVFHLAPGLELHLSDGAPVDTVRLARRILRELSIHPSLPGGFIL
jgi:Ca-activated chloride channel family protein